MKKARLLKLAEVLENFQTEKKNLVKPVKKFDMETWYTCGSAACALGTAMLHPYFRRLGLKDTPLTFFRENHDGVDWQPEFKGAEDWTAGAVFFDISLSDSYYLFDPGKYEKENPTPKFVAKRIRAFVADAGKPVEA